MFSYVFFYYIKFPKIMEFERILILILFFGFTGKNLLKCLFATRMTALAHGNMTL